MFAMGSSALTVLAQTLPGPLAQAPLQGGRGQLGSFAPLVWPNQVSSACQAAEGQQEAMQMAPSSLQEVRQGASASRHAQLTLQAKWGSHTILGAGGLSCCQP